MSYVNSDNKGTWTVDGLTLAGMALGVIIAVSLSSPINQQTISSDGSHIINNTMGDVIIGAPADKESTKDD